jgi:TolB-like protein
MRTRVGSVLLGFVSLVSSLVSSLGPAVSAEDQAGGAGIGKRMAVINFSDADEDSTVGAANEVTTMAVSTLTSRRRDQAWIGNAIADLLIQDLSRVRSLAILERQRMQAFSDEVSLGDSALFDREVARRVGRVARVEKVLFGNYELKSSQIHIEVLLLDLDSQEVDRRVKTSGHRNELRKLVQELALRIVAGENVSISDEERERVRHSPTDSFTATERFYRGLDFYDGRWATEALGEFIAARQQDGAYHEARLWLARTFETMGRPEHAVLTYESHFRDYPRSIEARDALLFAARIHDRQRGDSDSLESCTPISRDFVRAPRTMSRLCFGSESFLSRRSDRSRLTGSFKSWTKRTSRPLLVDGAAERHESRVSRAPVRSDAIALSG